MPGTHLIHCAYHKCLTVYFRRVMDAVFNRCLPWSAGYRHFNSHLHDFLAGYGDLRVASVNNRALEPDSLGPCRISRFLRDPRDLVVSGYFYHRRGAEPWVTMANPTDEDWYFAAGVVPEGLRAAGGSFADYLQAIPEEEGLLAELEFRASHFESMARWPAEHPHVLTLRYEDILGNEITAFRRIFEHYGLSHLESGLGTFFARRHALGRRRKDPHIRNPSSGQWQIGRA
ncbi:MAG: sulfotransferase domain-containing protein, partial [Holophagales bacterium]|nr:sulfotransferase domain-containing protein [Holophagales bacterium]